MCEFSDAGDVNIDSTDMSTDINDTVDSYVTVENIDMEMYDISEDVVDDFTDFETESESMDIDDVSEDVYESIPDQLDVEYSDDTYELEEDIGEGISECDDNSLETIYENGYEYILDDEGRVSSVEGDLRLEEGKRDLNAQKNAGGEFRRETDDGGHFIGNRFNGSGGDINMFAQDSNFNRGGYKSMENEWARELEKGNDVHVKINPVYQEGTERPHAVMGEYTITEDGNGTKEYFSFTNENLRSEEFNIDDYDFEFEKEKSNK